MQVGERACRTENPLMVHPLKYLLGVDLGTTSTKASIFTPEGALVSEGRAPVHLLHPSANCIEQDFDDIYDSAASAVRKCFAASSVDPSDVVSVAFDSQMAGIGAVDEHFRPAIPFDSWLDMRCKPYIEELSQKHAKRIAQLTGCGPTCDHGPKILWRMHERPDQYKSIAKWVMPAGYVAGKICGLTAENAFIDYTFLHFTALANAEEGAWSPELCGLLGIDPARLPRIVSPWQQVGEVQPEAARHFGLAPGTRAAAGCGDTAAGALGAGIVRPGLLLDTAGTASVLACSTDRYVADTQNLALMTMRSVIPGLWNPLAYVGGGGLAVPWFRDHFTANGNSGTYDQAFDLAAQAPPGCDGLLFSPHLGGRICPAAPQMRGAWIGFSWEHSQAHFSRSILESVAFEYRYYLRILSDLVPGLELTEARVIGGGAKTPIWNQIKADVLGVPYRKLPNEESATWGAALIAGKAAGLFTDLAEPALAALPEGVMFEPTASTRQLYDGAFARYLGWQQELQKGFQSHGY
jgi:xylulokinase